MRICIPLQLVSLGLSKRIKLSSRSVPEYRLHGIEWVVEGSISSEKGRFKSRAAAPWMAHLFTRHDPFHLHKTLGLLALLNFILRIYYAIRYGNSFPDFESKRWACACVLIHAALPLTSLALPLPTKRNFSSPMIWPEFRLHSILFACRHVICTVISILELWPTQILGTRSAAPVLAECGMKVLIVLAFVYIARMITDRYGDKEHRTTNAMPYPHDLSEDECNRIKFEYAKKQFGATLMATFPGHLAATFNFAPLYAIQSAPFMMTLVRKGKCNARAYHCVYAATLLYPLYMYHVIIRRGSTYPVDFVIGCLYMASFRLRIRRRWSNEAMWAIIVPLVILAWTYLPGLEAGWIAPSILSDTVSRLLWIIMMGRELVWDASVYGPLCRGFVHPRRKFSAHVTAG